MQKPLLGQKIAFLVANGFTESDLVEPQRALQALGADTRIISMDQGLVNSWNGEGWGLNFAADQALNTALAVDYDGVVIPGGARSIHKLQLTAHTRRIVKGFVEAHKPAAALCDASEILRFAEIDLGLENVLECDLDLEKIQRFFTAQLCGEKALAA